MQKLDPVLWLLTGLVILFSLLLFVAEHFFPMEGQIFQVMSGLLTGFGGALLMRVKPPKTADEIGSGTASVSVEATVIKEDKPAS